MRWIIICKADADTAARDVSRCGLREEAVNDVAVYGRNKEGRQEAGRPRRREGPLPQRPQEKRRVMHQTTTCHSALSKSNGWRLLTRKRTILEIYAAPPFSLAYSVAQTTVKYKETGFSDAGCKIKMGLPQPHLRNFFFLSE